MNQLTAQKNKRAYFVDIVKIICGSLLTVLIILIILIFRNSVAFIRGKYSLLDFNLLFLLLTVKLTVSGVKYFRNHKKMPEIMLRCGEGSLIILGEEVACRDIKELKGKFEFGCTGTVIITAVSNIYRLYGVKEYANVINSIDKLVKE